MDSHNQLKVAQAMQDQKRALESENEILKSRIGQLENETGYDRSQKGNQLMSNYEEMGMANKSYLSSEIM